MHMVLIYSLLDELIVLHGFRIQNDIVVHAQAVFHIRLYDSIFVILVQYGNLLEIRVPFVDIIYANQRRPLAYRKCFLAVRLVEIIPGIQDRAVQIVFLCIIIKIVHINLQHLAGERAVL